MGPSLSTRFEDGPLYWLPWLPFVVHGESMLPNLGPEQYVLVRRLGRGRGPSRGDVVVFRHHLRPGMTLLKRVVGLPGDRVRVRRGRVYVDGRMLDEPYLPYLNDRAATPDTPDLGSSRVPGDGVEWTLHEDQYFVLGDNRNPSPGSRPDDSRRFGPVELGSIIGAAWFRYWPPGAWGPLRPSPPGTV
jgi:signal peptidase I